MGQTELPSGKAANNGSENKIPTVMASGTSILHMHGCMGAWVMSADCDQTASLHVMKLQALTDTLTCPYL